MSDEEEALIRSAVERWNEGGFDAFVADFLAEDTEWHTPAQYPEKVVWHGRDAIRDGWHTEFDAVFENMRSEVIRLDRASKRWFLELRSVARSPISGAELDWHSYYLVEVDEWKLRFVREFMDERLARQVAAKQG